MYDPDAANRQKFDICVPRASYIACAFINFINSFDFSKSVNVNYRETNSLKTIDNVANAVNKLGIIRYNKMYEKYFLNVLNERNLKYSVIWEFEYVVLMSENHPLAGRSTIDYRELEDCTEIVHGDPGVPALPITEVRERAKYDENKKRIHVYERASQFEMLQQIPSAYMLVSPIPDSFVRRLSLVQRKCSMENNVYADLLIYRKGCRLHAHDKLFIDNVRRVISEVQSER
ncbi:MAG: LysR family transcriptional regulator [Clostridiales bacterium]|nr:LysR family transcriptional regulator [Clostridiales bacterium]